jgi:hypothetical protein
MNVLEHQSAVDEIEAVGGARLQIVRFVQEKSASVFLLMQQFRCVDHGRRDIDADDFVKAASERSRHPTGSAAEVQGAATADLEAQVFEAAHQGSDVGSSRFEKILERPLVAFLVGRCQDRPERIPPSEFVPVSPQASESH